MFFLWYNSPIVGNRHKTSFERILNLVGPEAQTKENSYKKIYDDYKFYDKLDYQRAAVIPEFYAAGEDKVVFWKKLN